MAFSVSSLRRVVKPEKREEYQGGLTGLWDVTLKDTGDRWLSETRQIRLACPICC